MLNFKEIISVSLILFSVIDILGSVPIVIDLRKKLGHIQSGKATIVAGIIMIAFLYLGESILKLFGLDISSFAIAGALVMFLIGMEMVLGITIFKHEDASASIAFPLIAGAGTMTTLISLKAEYEQINIIIGVALNLVLIFVVLKTCGWLERKIGQAGFSILRKVFGIILLAISIKLFKNFF
jgi:multiple antibiotic resistance protein